MSRKMKIILRILFLGVSLYLIISFILGYLKMKPHLEGIFSKGSLLEQNQSLTDSILTVHSSEGLINSINLKEGKKIIHFFNVESRLCKWDVNTINQFVSKNNTDQELLIISLNEASKIEEFEKNNELKFKIFLGDTANIPIKIKELLFPYTIEISDFTITKSYLGRIKL